MPELTNLMTVEELGSTCSQTHPVNCNEPAAYKLRLAMGNPSHKELREMIVLACQRHFAELQAESPDSIIAWQPFKPVIKDEHS